MSTKNFENNRWNFNDQKLVFRHKAALAMIEGDGLSVLDLGCGDGLFLEMLRSKGLNGAGLDISDIAVSKCREKGLNANVFDLADPVWPFKDGQFDYAVFLDNLEHVFCPEKLINSASRVADKIIIGVPNFNSLPARLQVLSGKVPENNRPKKGHVYWFNYNILKEMASGNNLEIMEIRSNTIWENKPFFGTLFKYLSKKYPNIFALSFVVKLKKIF